MGDVAVVADPVNKLAAAGVVVPAPVLIDAGFDVGLHLGGADPGVVVEIGRGLGDGEIPGGCSGNDLRGICDFVGQRGECA